MKRIKLLVAALILYSTMSAQDKVYSENGLLLYTKTQHTITLGKETLPVYQYKTGEYFTIMTNPKTGRTYWQPLEREGYSRKPKQTKPDSPDHKTVTA